MNTRYGKSKIWYGNGEIATDIDEAPKTGVICIVQFVNGARRISHGQHGYWQLDDEWVGGDAHDMMMYLAAPGVKRVFYGAMINTHIYNAIMAQASKDPEFPKVQVT